MVLQIYSIKPKNEYPTHFWIRAPKAPGGEAPPLYPNALKHREPKARPGSEGAVHNVSQDFIQMVSLKFYLVDV